LGFGRRATYTHVARLARAGLAVREFDPGGSVVAITAAGRRAIGADRGAVRIGATHGDGLRHARAVSWVAALLTLRERGWVGEREMRGDPGWLVPVVWAGSRGRHRPDLGIELARGSRVAVEVELTHKSPRRLDAIVSGYEDAIVSGRFAGGVIYVSDRGDVLEAVQRATGRIGLPDRWLRTRRLSDVQADVQRRAQERRAAASERGRGEVSGSRAALSGLRVMQSLSIVDEGRADR
jgi:hypothetical protein